MELTTSSVTPGAAPAEHLSYKFQRLRERLRQAVISGELSGKLPGERELARRFKANPKTLSKALTDLASEGLLERSVGRGTFVRGSAPMESNLGRWLVLAAESQIHSPLVEQILKRNSETEIVTAYNNLRPSFLDRFTTVIDLVGPAADSLLRTLVLRGMSIVRIGHEPGSLKTHAVLLDREHAATVLTRQLVLAGHERILVIENGSTAVSAAARLAADRYSASATVDTTGIDDHAAIIGGAQTAILCDTEESALLVTRLADLHPQLKQVSIVAMGSISGQPAVNGIYVTAADLIATAADLLADTTIHKPTVLWLTGTASDRATVRPVPETTPAAAQAA